MATHGRGGRGQRLHRPLVLDPLRGLHHHGHVRDVRIPFSPSPLFGMLLTRPLPPPSGMVVDQARKGGFRLRTVDEIEENRAHLADAEAPSPIKRTSSDIDKKGSAEYVETI